MADAAKIESVLRRMERGESENAACKAVGIHRATFRSAALRFRVDQDYARATEAIARDQVAKADTVIEEMRNGELSPEIGRLELDWRKWVSSKLFRPMWGDKVALTGGGPGDLPIETNVTITFVDKKD